MQAAVAQVFRKPAADCFVDVCVGMFFFVVKLCEAGAGEHVRIAEDGISARYCHSVFPFLFPVKYTGLQEKV